MLLLIVEVYQPVESCVGRGNVLPCLWIHYLLIQLLKEGKKEKDRLINK